MSYELAFVRSNCAAGYRLVYQVEDSILVVTVIAVGKRDKSLVYRRAQTRLPNK